MTLGLWFLMGYHLWAFGGVALAPPPTPPKPAPFRSSWVLSPPFPLGGGGGSPIKGGGGGTPTPSSPPPPPPVGAPPPPPGPPTLQLGLFLSSLLASQGFSPFFVFVFLPNFAFSSWQRTGTVRLVPWRPPTGGFLLMGFHLGLHWGGAGPGAAVAGPAPALPPAGQDRNPAGGGGGGIRPHGVLPAGFSHLPVPPGASSSFWTSRVPLVFYGDHLALMGPSSS